HRVYEYFNSMSREELEHFVDEGYAQWLKGWYCKEGMKDIMRILYKNQTARWVIFKNLFNPNVRKRISEGMSAFGSKKENGEKATS
ncbi:MAG TPA: hypothetical protein VMS79_05300, partial [Methanomassiliicoccales archaeon]|nr:hypothetical protein [Methanomassiliicoccales archaeon]